MNILQQVDAAKDQLQDLEAELAAKRERQQRLTATLNLPELARQKLAGGVVFFQTGNLRELQMVELEVKVLQLAIGLQRERIADWEEHAAEAELEDMRRHAEATAGQIVNHLSEAVSLFRQLDRCGAGDVHAGSFDTAREMQRLADQVASACRQLQTRRTIAGPWKEVA